jgi:hypothetical protein
MTTTAIKKNSTKSFASRTKEREKYFEFTAPEPASFFGSN